MNTRIDTHQHILPPEYGAWLRSKGAATAGGVNLPNWSKDGALRIMDQVGIEASILSAPGVYLGNDREAREQDRQVNEFTAGVVGGQPDRFGFFATLTLPDAEGALEELAYAYDHLHADGVVLMTSVRGLYLGNSGFEPVMSELNRRKAVVFVHPADLPGPSVPNVPSFAVDFMLETARAVMSLVMSGTTERYPDIKFLLAHAGGFIPYVAYRVAAVLAKGGDPQIGLAALRRFYYDTALSSSPAALPSLLAVADPTHVTFGTDWPWAPEQIVSGFTKMLDSYDLSEDQRNGIDRRNAEQLFPRFKA